jgi:hypothetical protein
MMAVFSVILVGLALAVLLKTARGRNSTSSFLLFYYYSNQAPYAYTCYVVE